MSENPTFFIPGAPPESPRPASMQPSADDGGESVPAPRQPMACRPGVMDPRDESPTMKPQGIRFFQSTGLCTAGLLAAFLVRGTVSHHGSAMSDSFVAFGVCVLVALGISLVPFWLAKRSNKALNISMCVLMLFGLSGIAVKTWEENASFQDKRTIAGVDRQLDALREKAKQQVEENGSAALTADDLNKVASTMRHAANKLDGDEAASMRASSVLMSEFAQRNKQISAVIDRFAQLGGLDPATIKSKEEIQQRLTLVQQFLSLNESFTQHVKTTPRQFRDLLMKEGVDQKKLGRAESDFASGFKLRLQLRLRDVERQFGESAREYLSVLNDQWGHWKLDPASGQVVFSNESAIGTFNRASESLQIAMRDESDIQRQVLNMQQAIAEVGGGKRE